MIRSKPLILSLLPPLWALGIALGIYELWSYAATAGTDLAAPPQWPTACSLPRDPIRATLVIAIHPRCPCTRATIEELAKIMRHGFGRVVTHALMVKPRGVPEGWEATDLWTSAARIPDVHVHVDEDGAESRRFGAATSGSVALYDREGRLVFEGGITSARGHVGENPGAGAIISLLITGDGRPRRTPVFGCALFAPGDPENCSLGASMPCPR